MAKKKNKGGRAPVPGCRQISFWGSERKARRYSKAADQLRKQRGLRKFSRSEWLLEAAEEKLERQAKGKK